MVAQEWECAGADFILVCTNTMHKAFDQVRSYVQAPLPHIAQVTAALMSLGKLS